MENIETIKAELEFKFPEYTFTIGKRIYGKCIIAKNSKYSGADIFIKKSEIIIQPGIPEMKSRILIGAGALFLKYFRKDYSEPAKRIKNYLLGKYSVRLRE